jgi:Cu-processing system permease protein
LTQTILTLARFSLLEAMRTRIALVALALLGVGGILAWFAGQVAITETRQIQAVLLASFLRFVAVFVTAVFVIVTQTREATDKGMEILLSLPTPRSAYYLGKLLGYLASAWSLAIIFGLSMLLLGPTGGVITWTVSLGLELSIVAAASLFFVTTLNHLPAALAAVVGFYLLSRSISAFRLISGSPLINDGATTPMLMQWSLDGIAALLPRLDLFTQAAWLIEQTPPFGSLFSLAGQSVNYTTLLTLAGLVDLHRKNF